jgi:hypothetical protein
LDVGTAYEKIAFYIVGDGAQNRPVIASEAKQLVYLAAGNLIVECLELQADRSPRFARDDGF